MDVSNVQLTRVSFKYLFNATETQVKVYSLLQV